MTRLPVRCALVALLGPSCTGATGTARQPAADLDASLAPSAAAQALRRLGGAHLRGTARFAVGLAPAASTEAGTALEAVTTTTDVWLDSAGNYRLVESNDRDGGREIVLHGRELFVALRYTKMVRRPAEDPEPMRLLEQAAGAPWAAWDLVRHVAALAPLPAAKVNGRATRGFRLSRASAVGTNPAGQPPLRKWRESAAVDRVEGEVRLDEATGAPLSVSLRVGYAASQEGKVLRGEAEVRLEVDGVGATPSIARPTAGELQTHQRTVPEEKALLGGLGALGTRPGGRAAPEKRKP